MVESSGSRNRLLAVLLVGVLVEALDIAIVGPALPAIRSDLSVGAREAGWVLSTFVLFTLLSTPLMAKLSDVHGRRAIYVLDVAVFAVGSLVVALAPAFWVLLLGRAIQGLGAGGIFPVATAVVGDAFPPERRGRYLGLLGAVFGIAFVLGPVVAGVVLTFLTWPWLFLVNLPVAAGVIVGAWRLLPADPSPTRAPFDWRGMATLGGMMAALAVGVNRLDTTAVVASLLSPTVWPLLLLAAVLVPAFRWAERRAEDPLLDLALFRSPQISIAAALSAGTGLAEAAVVFVPDLLVLALGVTEATASFMLVPLVLAMAVGAPLFGRLLDHVGSRVVVVMGAGLLSVGLVGVGFLPVEGTVTVLGFETARLVVAFYGAGLLVGLGLASLVGASLRYVVINAAPRGDRAAAQGLLTLSLNVGQLVGGVAVAAVAASLGGGVVGYKQAFLVVGGVMMLLWFAGLGLKGRDEELRAARANHAGSGPT